MRIEDTDLERSKPEFLDDILTCLRWLGMNWDNELMFQSQRLEMYRAKAESLADQGEFAYRCTCTAEDVEAMRAAATAKNEKPMYDRRCRELKISRSTEVPYVIRAKVPLAGQVVFDDLIHGESQVQWSEVDDFVLIRSNGAPTYNWACVLDDAEMQISHVLRGDDHLNNTPKQIFLYSLIGSEPPLFGHLSMILGSDKKKLSKRNGDVATNHYRSQGYLPQAVLNFLVRLGWSHGDQEVFQLQEMIDAFDLEHVQKSGAVFNPEKFLWLNAEHIRSSPPKVLAELLINEFGIFPKDSNEGRALVSDFGLKLLAASVSKVKLLPEFLPLLRPLLIDSAPGFDPSGLALRKKPELAQNGVVFIREYILGVCAFEPEHRAALVMETTFKEKLLQTGLKIGDVLPAFRLLMSGSLQGLGVFDVLAAAPVSWCQNRFSEARLHSLVND